MFNLKGEDKIVYIYKKRNGREVKFNCKECDLNKTGIYQIKNLKNGKRYIGMTRAGFMKRWRQHITQFSTGRHCNKELKRDWNMSGCENFEFDILEFSTLSSYEMELLEYSYMKKLNTFKPKGYNVDTFKLRKNLGLWSDFREKCMNCSHKIKKEIKGTGFDYIDCALGEDVGKKGECFLYIADLDDSNGRYNQYLLENYGSEDIDEITEIFLEGKLSQTLDEIDIEKEKALEEVIFNGNPITR